MAIIYNMINIHLMYIDMIFSLDVHHYNLISLQIYMYICYYYLYCIILFLFYLLIYFCSEFRIYIIFEFLTIENK